MEKSRGIIWFNLKKSNTSSEDSVSFGYFVEGIATSKELPLGKYTLKETKTPAGLAMNYKEYEVVLEKDSENKVIDISLDIENDVIDTEINVYKVGEMLNPDSEKFYRYLWRFI